MKNPLLCIALLLTAIVSTPAFSQSFTESDIDRLLSTYKLGAYAELRQLKDELIFSENGFRLLQDAPDHSHTKIFIDFGKNNESPSVGLLEQMAFVSDFESLEEWIRVNDRVLGVANAALHTGWGLYSADPRYNDPDFPNTLAYLKDRSISWAKRVVAIDEFNLWCEKICVNPGAAEEDKLVLAPRYLEVVKALFPKET